MSTALAAPREAKSGTQLGAPPGAKGLALNPSDSRPPRVIARVAPNDAPPATPST